MNILNNIARDQRHRARFAVATSVSLQACSISLREALDALASLLLRLGWAVRMLPIDPDSQVGVLAVSARAFSPTELVQLDSHHRLSLITLGESLPVIDVPDLVRVLQRRQATFAARPLEAVPA